MRPRMLSFFATDADRNFRGSLQLSLELREPCLAGQAS